jgi:hypothetical protein
MRPPRSSKTAEGQGVGTEHPLAVGDRDVQRVLGRGQRHDDDRRVQHDHELGNRDDRERPVALGIELGLVLRW